MLNEQRTIAADKLIGTAIVELNIEFDFDNNTMLLFDRVIRLSKLSNIPPMGLVEEMVERRKRFESYEQALESMLNEYLLTGTLERDNDPNSPNRRIRGYVIGVDMASREIHVDAQTEQDSIMNYKLEFEADMGNIFAQIQDGDWIELTIEHTGEQVDEDDDIYGSWLTGKVCRFENINCSSRNVLNY